jgi:hypothetical protein
VSSRPARKASAVQTATAPVGEGLVPSRQAAAAAAPPSVRVGERERVLLVPELAAFVAGLSGSVRADYEVVLAAVEAGDVTGPALGKLETFLELGLSTGRLRGQLGQHSEDALRRLFDRTPRGAALSASAGEVTTALRGLVGHELSEIALTSPRPGEYRLAIEAGSYRVSVALGPGGARVESVELGL